MPIKPLYSDINLRMTENPEELVLDSDSINQNIINIFETPVGSKWFRPEIGSSVNKYLFEPIDEITADRIKNEMVLALEGNGEFRVIFDDVEVYPDPSNAQYFVRITYHAPGLENSFNFNFNLYK